MMLRELQKKLDLSWIKENSIWDIVVYGSYVRGNAYARDIDIAIIVGKESSVRQKRELCTALRRLLAGKEHEFDVKAVDMRDFLNPALLSRESILAEGYSLLKGDLLAERFGFAPVARVEYTRKNLLPAKQKLFYYALRGRKKGEGLLPKVGGTIISKGVLLVPTKHYEEVRALLEQHGVSYTTTFTLQYRVLH